MSLAPGASLGPYEVVSAIGAGGMGEVYRARDTKLNRDVALKMLPEAFAADPDRRMRFEREAKTLAALNHPNIAQIYGIEDRALVMELVEGEDLAVRLARGPVPLDDALPIARQVAEALEAAHEAGIIHRDLKPANIKVRDDGTVKVLDFGLAKATTGVGSPGGGSPIGGGPGLPTPDTVTSPALTQMGIVLGTAAYMSPEQARGRPVDRRADIWAFGVVLYEMLTGRRAFRGDDISETLAGVLKEDVDWSALPTDLPAPIRRVLRRCIEKDPRRRLSAIGDARLELEEPGENEPVSAATVPPASRRSTGRLVAAVAAAVVATAAVTLWVSTAFRPESAAPQRLTVLAPAGQPILADSANVAISPDGRRLAFLTGSSVSTARLWIRALDDLEPREVENSTGAALPFWSPDGETVGFFARGKLMTVPAAGGRPQEIADAPDGRGGTWNTDNVIVFAPSNAGPLSRVSSNGGAVGSATTLRSDDGETGHRFPSFLPDGQHYLFAVLPATSGLVDIYVGELGSTASTFLLGAESTPVYADPGYLVYSRNGILVAHPFDASRRALAGEAVPLGDRPGELNIQYSAGHAASVSRTGGLAYLSTALGRSRLAWLDQTGREVGTVEVPAGPHVGLTLSGDARRAAVVQLEGTRYSIWLADVARGGLTPLIRRESGWNGFPALSPDGRRLAFSSDRGGPADLYLRALDAPDDELLYASPDLFKHISSWSPDGQVLVYTDTSPETGSDLWTIQPDGDRTPRLFLRTAGGDAFGTISPDGRWMAYVTDQAGQPDAYVQAFPGPGREYRITTGGTLDWGIWWKADGRQLLMLDADLQLLLVDVRTTPEFSASAPRVVGRLRFPPVATRSIDATPDLQRLLALVPERIDGGRSLTVLQHWSQAVRARTP